MHHKPGRAELFGISFKFYRFLRFFLSIFLTHLIEYRKTKLKGEKKMSTLIQNFKGSIDSMRISILASKLNNPDKAHEYAEECSDMLEKASTEDVEAELSRKMSKAILAHSKDEKAGGVAAAALNIEGTEKYCNELVIATTHAALSLITSPVSGPADSVLCATASRLMKTRCRWLVAGAFMPEISRLNTSPSLKAAIDCAKRYAEEYKEFSKYRGCTVYENTISTCADHQNDPPELLLALTAAKTIREDVLGDYGCRQMAVYYAKEIATVTGDETTRTVTETLSRICKLDTIDLLCSKGPILYPVFDVLAEVIKQPGQSDNPAEVLASAENSLFLKWKNGRVNDVIFWKAEKIFEEDIAKADKIYSTKMSIKKSVNEVKEMAKAVSGGKKASYTEINDEDGYVVIDGIKLKKR